MTETEETDLIGVTPEELAQKDWQRLPRALKVAAIIFFLGPLFGALAMLALILPRAALEGIPSTLEGALNVGWLIFIVVLYAYILASPLCLIAASILAWRTYLRSTFGWPEALAVAVFSTVVGNLIVALVIGGNTIGLMMLTLPFALVSALICRWLMVKFGVISRIA